MTEQLLRATRLRLAASILLLCALFGASFAGAAVAAESETLEDAVKATYLYKFAPFVEWPAGAFAAAPDTFHLCVLGYGPIGDVVDRAASGQRLGDRPIVVHRLQSVDRPAGCHILYIALTEADRSAEILRAVRGTPVLTVTNAAPDRESKGIINFVVQDNRVRFEIDTAAAAENGLAVSSKLLSLAVQVKSKL